MTREEAIETLKANYPDACFELLREAVDTAISALQAQDVPETNVGDLISRQAAIEIFDCSISGVPFNVVRYVAQYADKMLVKIKALPPAQQNCIARETAGKSPEEIYDFLYWLMFDYAKQFTDSRLAVIEWLKGEEDDKACHIEEKLIAREAKDFLDSLVEMAKEQKKYPWERSEDEEISK